MVLFIEKLYSLTLNFWKKILISMLIWVFFMELFRISRAAMLFQMSCGKVRQKQIFEASY